MGYNQKGGISKSTGVDHEVIVDPNDMKDAPDLLMKDDGDAGSRPKQGKLRYGYYDGGDYSRRYTRS